LRLDFSFGYKTDRFYYFSSTKTHRIPCTHLGSPEFALLIISPSWFVFLQPIYVKRSPLSLTYARFVRHCFFNIHEQHYQIRVLSMHCIVKYMAYNVGLLVAAFVNLHFHVPMLSEQTASADNCACIECNNLYFA